MYGLKQAAMLGRENIIQVLKPFGYSPNPLSPNIWKHHTLPTKFCSCVDDFGVKYYNKQHLHHLTTALRTAFKIKVEDEATSYCGLNLKWNYSQGFVDVSITEYVIKALGKLQHTPSIKTTT